MACLGASPDVMADVWARIDLEGIMQVGVDPIWMCNFLKLYNLEAVNGRSVGEVDQKAFWKWTWLFSEATSPLEFPVVRMLQKTMLLTHVSSTPSKDMSAALLITRYHGIIKK